METIRRCLVRDLFIHAQAAGQGFWPLGNQSETKGVRSQHLTKANGWITAWHQQNANCEMLRPDPFGFDPFGFSAGLGKLGRAHYRHHE